MPLKENTRGVPSERQFLGLRLDMFKGLSGGEGLGPAEEAARYCCLPVVDSNGRE